MKEDDSQKSLSAYLRSIMFNLKSRARATKQTIMIHEKYKIDDSNIKNHGFKGK